MRKVILIATILIVGFLTAPNLYAALFTEDFESDLSNWTGKNQGSHNGSIVQDPFNADNHVLQFTKLNAGGDIFTINTFSSSNGFILSFDYLGDANSTEGSGGFIGYSYGFAGTHKWLAGADSDYNIAIKLPDTGNWEHIEIPFNATGNIHLMLEEYRGSDGTIGNAYFDNIELSAVPVPASAWLLISGIAGLVGIKKRRSIR